MNDINDSIHVSPYFNGVMIDDSENKKALRAELNNTDVLWEAIGPDGIEYPFPTCRYNSTDEERVKIVAMVNAFDDVLARKLAGLIMMDTMTSDAAIGKIIREQAIAYAQKNVDMED